jgi:hypothetical protein
MARQNETEGTRGNSVLHKKGVEELLHVEQPSCTSVPLIQVSPLGYFTHVSISLEKLL